MNERKRAAKVAPPKYLYHGAFSRGPLSSIHLKGSFYASLSIVTRFLSTTVRY
jgi:hypothetical protein